jgi:hypothetical protein
MRSISSVDRKYWVKAVIPLKDVRFCVRISFELDHYNGLLVGFNGRDICPFTSRGFSKAHVRIRDGPFPLVSCPDP